MIELAKLIDPEARAVRKSWRRKARPNQQAHALIEKAAFGQSKGTSNYPTHLHIAPATAP